MLRLEMNRVRWLIEDSMLFARLAGRFESSANGVNAYEIRERVLREQARHEGLAAGAAFRALEIVYDLPWSEERLEGEALEEPGDPACDDCSTCKRSKEAWLEALPEVR